MSTAIRVVKVYNQACHKNMHKKFACKYLEDKILHKFGKIP